LDISLFKDPGSVSGRDVVLAWREWSVNLTDRHCSAEADSYSANEQDSDPSHVLFSS
jgi:hypothetical protein